MGIDLQTLRALCGAWILPRLGLHEPSISEGSSTQRKSHAMKVFWNQKPQTGTWTILAWQLYGAYQNNALFWAIFKSGFQIIRRTRSCRSIRQESVALTLRTPCSLCLFLAVLASLGKALAVTYVRKRHIP